jgi:integrase
MEITLNEAILPELLKHFGVMRQTGLKVRFYLKRSEADDLGVCPLMGRVVIGGTRESFSTRLCVPVALWDSKSGRLMGKSERAVSVNAELSGIDTAIHKCYRDILDRKGTATCRQVKDAYRGMASSQETLLKFYGRCNDNLRRRAGKDRAGSTAAVYDGMLRDLSLFVREKYGLSDIPFPALTYSFIESYDFWMRIDRRLKPGTIINRTGRLMYVIRQANSRGHIVGDPFAGHKVVRDAPARKFLTDDEPTRIIETPLPKRHLYLTRDMFLLACFTGLAFVDVWNLTGENLSVAEDGVWWIRTFRRKTKVGCGIPLLPIAVAIIEKYRGSGNEDKLLPVPALGTLNANLKTIAKVCGIERNVTYHVGRHTFASEITLSQGLSLESVCALLGHSDIRSTQIYAKTTQDKLSVDMAGLDDILETKFKFAVQP